MKKNPFEGMHELGYVLMLFVVSLMLFKIAFYKENFAVLFRTVISVFFVFIIPGYFLMIYWKDSISLPERLVIGSLASAALIGILSYYLGILGLNIKYHHIILPIALILGGILINNFKKIKPSV